MLTFQAMHVHASHAHVQKAQLGSDASPPDVVDLQLRQAAGCDVGPSQSAARGTGWWLKPCSVHKSAVQLSNAGVRAVRLKIMAVHLSNAGVGAFKSKTMAVQRMQFDQTKKDIKDIFRCQVRRSRNKPSSVRA